MAESDVTKLACIELQHWNDLDELNGAFGGFVYRGHASADWSLSSSLERACTRHGFSLTHLPKFEEDILIDFQRRAHLYVNNLPGKDDLLEWFSLMQHYGAPTRLVDFTKSLYIAAFFAMEDSEDDAAIWCINMDVVENNALFEDIDELLSANSDSLTEVGVLEPHILNERVSIQQGLFAIPANIREPFTENLANTVGVKTSSIDELGRNCEPQHYVPYDEDLLDCSVVKLILPNRIHNDGMWRLKNMNISSASLFPGLEGYARSLKQMIRDVL